MRDNEIELWSSTRVTGLGAGLGELLLEGDRRLGYGRLLLTTGAVPRRLEVPGAKLDGIHYLRTLADSERIGERIERGQPLVVVGSGWIGSEIAASARQKGCEVTMIEMASLPLERVLGPEVGQIYLDIHRDHGVEFLPETTVERFEGQGSVERLVTQDGASIETEFVVVGVGVAPRTGLVETAGLRVDNGVVVDEHLESSAPGIFAAGDVANAHHPFYGRHLRVEHWANALNQGPVAARAMLGKEVAYDEIPYFFSDQYEVGMEYSGFATSWDEVVFRGDVEAREFIAFWLEDDRVVAGMNVNVWDVNDAIRELIRSRHAVDASACSRIPTCPSTLSLRGDREPRMRPERNGHSVGARRDAGRRSQRRRSGCFGVANRRPAGRRARRGRSARRARRRRRLRAPARNAAAGGDGLRRAPQSGAVHSDHVSERRKL